MGVGCLYLLKIKSSGYNACLKTFYTSMMTTLCPCSSGLPYHDCCKPLHQGDRHAADAEALMRSRYAAYALQQIDYLIATTVPAQQSLLNRGAIEAWSRQAEWLGLTVLQHRPKVGKHHAQVEFEARFREQGESHSHHELSAFVQIEQRWYFIDSTVPLPGMKTPCFCGSGKKFKQCCGQFLRD